MVNTIYSVSPAQLKEQGVRAVFSDLDNTLIAWNNPDGTPELKEWMDALREAHIPLIVISNNINDFLKNYRLIFSEMAKHTSKNHYVIEPMYETLEKLIEIHIEKGEINPPISSDKFAYFLLNNLILTSRSELTIDDLLLLLNI